MIRKMMSKEEELSHVSFVKTALMFLVIIGHSVAFWNGTWFTKDPVIEAPFLGLVYSWLGSFHIYAFALVSGYLFSYVKYERNGYNRYAQFLSKKALRLLVPYYFVMLIWVLPFNIYFYKFNVRDCIVKLLFAVSPSQLWFLWMLFIVFLICWPLSEFFHKHSISSLFVVFVVHMIGVLVGNSTTNYFQIFKGLEYILFFWTGFKIRQLGSDWLQKIPVTVWIIVDWGLLYCLSIIPTTNYWMTGLYYMTSMLLHLWGAVMAFIILCKIARFVHYNNSKTLGLLFVYSMPMYLFHQQIIWGLIAAFNGAINPYLHALINVVVATGISFLISHILMRWKATRFLLGES